MPNILVKETNFVLVPNKKFKFKGYTVNSEEINLLNRLATLEFSKPIIQRKTPVQLIFLAKTLIKDDYLKLLQTTN